MTTWTGILRRIVVVTFCLVLPGQHEGAFAEQPEAQWTDDAAYHRVQAAKYRQEAQELQHAIQHYQTMADVYEKGSDRPTAMNYQGRQRMVERVKRTIQYFTQAKDEMEQLAAEHEQLATVSQAPQGR